MVCSGAVLCSGALWCVVCEAHRNTKFCRGMGPSQGMSKAGLMLAYGTKQMDRCWCDGMYRPPQHTSVSEGAWKSIRPELDLVSKGFQIYEQDFSMIFYVNHRAMIPPSFQAGVDDDEQEDEDDDDDNDDDDNDDDDDDVGA